MSYPEYYTILGVKPSASMQDIKRAYHVLAKKLHPDVNKNDKKSEEQLKKVNEAYAVLKDLAKRAEYDYFGKQAEEAQKQSQNQQPEYTDSSPQTDTAPETVTIIEKRGFGFYLSFAVNKMILLAIMVAYMWFFYINIDKNEPYNVFKTLNNMADYMIEKVPEKSQFAMDRMKGLYAESEWVKKIEKSWEKLEKEIQNSGK